MDISAEDEAAKIVPRGLCTLFKYHTAKLSRDDDEWRCWGAPYVKMCAVILYVDGFHVLPSTRHEVLVEPVVLSTTTDGSVQEDDDPTWNVIRHNHEYFEGIVKTLRNKENRETLKILLGLLISKNFEMGNYDSRVRAVIKHVFSVVDLPSQYLFTLESQHTQNTGPYFNQADISTVGSAVTPYRSLQVCAVALSTGVVMYGVGLVTAPAILMAVQQLIRTGLMSTYLGQMILSSGVADATALAHLLVGMPELCSSAVAGASAVRGVHSAGKRMLHRTSPLSHFTLSPLFLPMLCTKDYVDVDSDIDGGLKRQSCLVLGAKEGQSQEDDDNIYMNSSLVIIEECENPSTLPGLKPVYFLVPGHIGDEIDLRDIFGAVSEEVVVDVDGGDTEMGKFPPSKVGKGIDAAAEVFIESVLDIVEDDVEKLNSLVKEVIGDKPEHESQFLTPPHLVRKNWWRELFPRGEEYILQWERTELADLNKKILNVLEGKLISHAVNAALAHFALTALWSSFSWANFVLDEIAELDGPWAVALDRSKQAGRILARLLLSNKFCQIESEEIRDGNTRSQDHTEGAEGVVIVNGDTFSWDDCAYENIRRGRPVTLIGYSMGARVIYHCLAELDACLPNVAGRGIVENVVLMGAPVSTDFEGWSAARRVVSGRLINCYSRKDWFLALMYRSNMYEPTVAGLQSFSLIKSAKFGIKTGGFCFMTSPPREEASPISDAGPTNGCVLADDDMKAVTEIAKGINTWSDDVECVDVSDIIKSHADYPNQVGRILEVLNLESSATTVSAPKNNAYCRFG